MLLQIRDVNAGFYVKKFTLVLGDLNERKLIVQTPTIGGSYRTEMPSLTHTFYGYCRGSFPMVMTHRNQGTSMSWRQ